ncbi:MAG TPA: hypothetical protein VGN18_01570 [Jatrophihabitans sp.]|jgi:uncharacterized protein with FMN-binding domain|uniref:hypothetical protein n=1 Tax=Jatrophihabitans sp. TaxID=1932789 RepID=UPI002E02B617|nr:hypothetical protein [Jatrophihabitans sp.]
MRRRVRAGTALLAGTAATLAPAVAAQPAHAAANPGQSVYNDYGQSAAEVTVEITTAVNANASVIRARQLLAHDHAVTLYYARAEAIARRAHLLAVASKNATRISQTRTAYYAARARTGHAAAVEKAARAALANTVAVVTAAIRARHYRPVDGTWTGDVAQYFIPDTGLEPVQVRITVYGGHVSDVTAPVYVQTGDSGGYNSSAIPTLLEEAMTAHDTASVAGVTGASETSGAFAQSLKSALVKGGFKF